jgi:ABC-type dipeptide/oligopeptide/nickel transport systems, permease components
MHLFRRLLKNPATVLGLILLFVITAMAFSAPFLFPRDPLSLAGRPLQWPFTNARFWLGTDSTGRDIAAQIFYGARISLFIGIIATAFSIVIGIAIGALAGYYGGIVDDILMRLTEAFQTLPNFILLLVLVAVFGSDLVTVTIAIGLVSWPAVRSACMIFASYSAKFSRMPCHRSLSTPALSWPSLFCWKVLWLS